jgi:hypothetical protein
MDSTLSFEYEEAIPRLQLVADIKSKIKSLEFYLKKGSCILQFERNEMLPGLMCAFCPTSGI